MNVSRRDFVKTAIVGSAGLCVGAYAVRGNAAEPQLLPEEDGYKLWLRYAAPGDQVKDYQKAIRQIHVEGNSATAGIIRDELRSAVSSLLGASIPTDQTSLTDGALVV